MVTFTINDDEARMLLHVLSLDQTVPAKLWGEHAVISSREADEIGDFMARLYKQLDGLLG